MTETVDQSPDARRLVETNRAWYHSIEVAPGVVTPGFCDLRTWAPKVLPGDLAGRRCLDVGTFDGFWAFEMERRGAESVVAIDIDDPEEVQHTPHARERALRLQAELGVQLGQGFRIASELLGSRVQRVTCNVYDLAPERVGGPVDFAVVGALLQHLRDPVQALENVRAALRPGGEAVLIDNVDVALTLLHPFSPTARLRAPRRENHWTWWIPSLAGLRGWARTAGLEPVGRLPALRRETRGLAGWFAAIRVRRPD